MTKARIQPLDDLEMFELLQEAYPENKGVNWGWRVKA